jgi:hypothetical protein
MLTLAWSMRAWSACAVGVWVFRECYGALFWFRPHLRLASAVGCRRESSAGYLDIEGEEAMSFFGGSEGDAEESQG